MVVISVQNAATVTISFLFWNVEASLAIAIVLSLIGGVAIASILILLLRLKGAMKRKDAASGQGGPARQEKERAGAVRACHNGKT